jgi:hypothetical protein
MKEIMTESNNLNSAHDEIARYAYHLWEAEGRPHGRDLEYWLQAEAHLKAHREYEKRVLQPAQKSPESPVPLTTNKNRSNRPRRQTKRGREQVFA